MADAWSGRTGFILATIGSAVGIGSVWKFPYELGANGGSAFLLFYLLGLAAIVVPLLFAEFAIGRLGGADPSGSLARVAAAAGADPRWRHVGTFGVVTGFLILSFYAVIGGWTLGYSLRTLGAGLPDTSAAATARFDAFLADPGSMLAYHAAFMAATALIVLRGVAGGIETASKVLMPCLVVLMIGLVVYSGLTGDLAAALDFLFRPDPARMSAGSVIEAVGLGFFSIGVGMCLMITYAAYSGREISLTQVAIVSVIADTVISLLAGLAVFPVVFAHGLDPAGGPGLVFVTLPLAFRPMPMGTIAAGAFFLLVFVAALASAISLLEIVVAMLTRRLGWTRRRATTVAALACYAGGIPTALSFNLWAGWHPLAWLPGLERAGVFELIDRLTSEVMLPAGGFAVAVFAGWRMPADALAQALGLSPRRARWLRAMLRWVAPGGIGLAAIAPLLTG